MNPSSFKKSSLELVPGVRRMELFYGGSREIVIRKTCELAAQAAQSLAEGETVLYLNVLCSEARLEHELQNVCRSRGGAATRQKLLAMTVKSDDLLSHTSFIEKTIESRRVQLVVLNTFDFAAMMPRRRTRLVAFLQQLRDFAQVDIAVGLRREPMESDAGSYAALSYQADAVSSLSDLTEFAIAQEVEEPSAAEGTLEREWQATILRPYQMQTRSLKTNDLESPNDTPTQEYAKAA